MRRLVVPILAAATCLGAQTPADFRPNAQALLKTSPGDARFDELGRLWNALVADLRDQVSRQSGREPDLASAQILARRRADVKNGAGSQSAGSTSAVVNPLLPAAFGFAFENGSVLRTISGNTATISVNPAGLVCATRVDASLVSLREPGCLDGWRRLGLTLSFDTNRGGKPSSVTGLKPLADQFTEAAVRLEIVNERQPQSRRFSQRLEEWKKSATAAANATNLLEIRLRPLRQELERRLMAELDASGFASLPEARKIDVLLAVVDDVRGRLPASDSVVREAGAAWTDMLRASNRVYNSFAHGLVVAAEYALQRPDLAAEGEGLPPSLHTARLVVSRGLLNYNLDFTLNASSSWFQGRRSGMTGSWRDFQVASDAKLRLRDIPDFGTPVLLLAGLWVHLDQRPLGIQVPTFVGTNLNQSGNIGIFQAKLELPTANAAVRIPISFTYSNRTDLLKESDVRAQVGISLNLDSFFADPSKR